MADQSGSQGLGVDGMASEDDLRNHGVGMDAMGSDEDLGFCPKPRVHVEKRLKKTANDIEAGKVKKDRDDWGDGAVAGGYEEKYRPSSSAMSDQSTGAPNHAPVFGVQRAPIERNDGAQPRLVTTAAGSDNPSASSNPSGINGLQSSAPPPFLNKTYDMVDDASTDAVVSWSAANNTFVVWNPAEFASDLLPKYFKHNNFSSFVRQLNTYGFRKVDPDRWEFANDGFLRGQRHLLKNIHRRKPVSHHHPPPQQQQTQSTPPGPFEDAGLEAEVRKLRTDKNVLMVELVRLQKQQLVTEQEMEVMNERLQLTEQRQQQMMSFLAKAMQSTTFLAQLVQQNENNKRIDTDRKRRRLPKQEIGGDSGATGFDGQIVKYQPTTNEAARAMMLFLDNNEVSSPIEPGGQLEALITDLVSAPIGQVQDSDMANHYSVVTLTEMQVSPTSIDETLTEPSLQDDPTVLEVRAVDRIDREASILSHPNSTESTGDVHVPFIHSSVGGQGLIGQDGESSAESKPTSGTSGQNDVFWQQFLTGNPESPSNESDDTETTDGMVQQVDEDKSPWWNSKPSVDRLAEQMGQLAPGIRL